MRRRVVQITKKVNEFVYAMGLILNRGRQTCTNLALTLGISHDKIYRFLSSDDFLLSFPKKIINLANKYSKKDKPGYLIIDDTLLCKGFSKFIEATYYFYNTIRRVEERCFCLVVIAWSNGKITIPLGFRCLIHKDIAKEKYKTKTDLCHELINQVKGKIRFTHIVFDGHYTTKENIRLLNEKGIHFLGKIPKNRVVLVNGFSSQIKNQPSLKLSRNQRSTVVQAVLNGMPIYISIHKRKNKNGVYKTTYCASNIKLNAKKYLILYEDRWKIEEMFRSLKQDIKIEQCQARSVKKQTIHIYASFLAYFYLQNIDKESFDFKSIYPSPVLKINQLHSSISLFNRNFGYHA